MKRSFLYSVLILFLVFIFINSCSERDTDEAITDAVDFAFITGDYEYVVKYYDSVDDTGATLSQKDVFTYLSAILSIGKFSLVNNISILMDIINGSSDSMNYYDIANEVLDTSNMSSDELKTLNQYYVKAANICNAIENGNNTTIDNDTSDNDTSDNDTTDDNTANNDTTGDDTVDNDTVDNDTVDDDTTNNNTVDSDTSLNTSISLVCGFAGALGFSTSLSSLLSDILGDEYEIDISKDGFQQALQDIEIDESLFNDMDYEELEAYAENLTTTLNVLMSNAETMDSIIGSDSTISDDVNEIAEILIDKETGQVTTESMLEYLISLQE